MPAEREAAMRAPPKPRLLTPADPSLVTNAPKPHNLTEAAPKAPATPISAETHLDCDPLMPMKIGLVERAFQIARTGLCSSCDEISERLRREGYIEVEEHFFSPKLRRQLTAICRGCTP